MFTTASPSDTEAGAVPVNRLATLQPRQSAVARFFRRIPLVNLPAAEPRRIELDSPTLLVPPWLRGLLAFGPIDPSELLEPLQGRKCRLCPAVQPVAAAIAATAVRTATAIRVLRCCSQIGLTPILAPLVLAIEAHDTPRTGLMVSPNQP